VSKRFDTFSALSFGLLCLTSSQQWYSVSTLTSSTLTFTGYQSNLYLAPTLTLIFLMALVGRYYKSLVEIATLGVSVMLLLLVAGLTANQMLTTDLSSVEVVIEKATGVAGWLSQLENMVTTVDTGVWSYVSLGLLLLLAVLQAIQLRQALIKGPKVPKLAVKRREPRVDSSEDDLWRQTSDDI